MRKMIITGLMLASSAMMFHSNALALTPYADNNQNYGNWYICGDLGVGFSKLVDNFDEALSIGAGIGYRFTDNFRMDLTVYYGGKYKEKKKYSYYYTYKQKFSAHATTYMVNAYFDVPNNSPVTPYFGIGAGIGNVRAKSKFSTSYGYSISESDSFTQFAMSGMAGLAFQINDSLELDVGYKHRRIFIEKDGYDDFYDHNLRTGLRFNF